MVGHSGRLEAAIKASKRSTPVSRASIKRCKPATRMDHHRRPRQTPKHDRSENRPAAHTYHTTNPVPFVLVTDDNQFAYSQWRAPRQSHLDARRPRPAATQRHDRARSAYYEVRAAAARKVSSYAAQNILRQTNYIGRFGGLDRSGTRLANRFHRQVILCWLAIPIAVRSYSAQAVWPRCWLSPLVEAQQIQRVNIQSSAPASDNPARVESRITNSGFILITTLQSRFSSVPLIPSNNDIYRQPTHGLHRCRTVVSEGAAAPIAPHRQSP